MSQNLQELLTKIAIDAQEVVSSETAVLALVEDEGETVFYAAAVGKNADFILNRRGATASSGLCGVAFQQQQPVLVCQAAGDSRVRQDMVELLKIKTALAVPLLFSDKLLGALMVLNRNDGGVYDEAAEIALADYALLVAPKVYQYLSGEGTKD